MHQPLTAADFTNKVLTQLLLPVQPDPKADDHRRYRKKPQSLTVVFSKLNLKKP